MLEAILSTDVLGSSKVVSSGKTYGLSLGLAMLE